MLFSIHKLLTSTACEQVDTLNISILMMAHALIGSIAVGSGAAALSLRKGSTAHRVAGRVFFGSMLSMGPVVAAGAWHLPGSISSTGALFSALMIYLPVSAWSTIRGIENLISPLDIAAPLLALCIAVSGFSMGLNMSDNPLDIAQGPQKEACYFFAALASVALLLDINNLRTGGVQGKHRIIRHVWRMACAMFFATSTLFTGPGAVVLPESIRGNPILLIPQLMVLMVALFWIGRLLFFGNRHSAGNQGAALE